MRTGVISKLKVAHTCVLMDAHAIKFHVQNKNGCRSSNKFLIVSHILQSQYISFNHISHSFARSHTNSCKITVISRNKIMLHDTFPCRQSVLHRNPHRAASRAGRQSIWAIFHRLCSVAMTAMSIEQLVRPSRLCPEHCA